MSGLSVNSSSEVPLTLLLESSPDSVPQPSIPTPGDPGTEAPSTLLVAEIPFSGTPQRADTGEHTLLRNVNERDRVHNVADFLTAMIPRTGAL